MKRLVTDAPLLFYVFLLIMGCSKKQKESFDVSETYNRTMEDTAQIMVIIEDDTMKIQEIGISPKTSESSPEEKSEQLSPIPQTDTDDVLSSSSQRGLYVLQVASFEKKEDAEILARRLTKKGYPAYIEPVESPTTRLKGFYYRVRIGFFQDIKEADTFGKKLKEKEKLEYWVDRR